MLVNVLTISLTERGTFKLSKIDKDKKGEHIQKEHIPKKYFLVHVLWFLSILAPFFDMCLKTSVRNFFLCLVLVRNNVEGLIESQGVLRNVFSLYLANYSEKIVWLLVETNV